MKKKVTKLITHKQLAAQEFEPWTRQAGEPDKFRAALKGRMTTLLIAFEMMHKSKPELAQVSEDLGDDNFMNLVKDLGTTAGCFRDMAKMLEGAECRLMSAAASLVEA